MGARIVEMEEHVQPENPAPAKPKLFIATPAYGCRLTCQYLQCLLQTQLTLSQQGFEIYADLIGNESLITRARNMLTKRFLQSDATHLLFIDADISWDPQAITRLVDKRVGVASTSYPKKFLNWDRVEARMKEKEGEPVQQAGLDFNLNVAQREVQVVEGFAEVLDAATGFMLVERQAIERMYRHYEKELLVVNDLMGASSTIKDYVAIFDCMIDPDTRRSLSEDFAFSRRWQQMGEKVYMDLLVPLGHTGSYHFEGDFKNRLRCTEARRALMQAPAVPEPSTDRTAPSPDGRKQVLLAILPHDGSVSLGFVMSLVSLVGELQKLNTYVAQIRFFGDRDEACDFMWDNSELHTMVFLDSNLGFKASQVIDMLQSASPFEVAAYPRAKLDWDKLGRYGDEPVMSRGLDYDVQLSSFTEEDSKKEPGKAEAVSAPLGLAKMDRCVLERVRDKLPPQCRYAGGKKTFWFVEGIADDRLVRQDEHFCLTWGSGVTVNAKETVSVLGNLTFVGVLLARKQIR